MLGLLPLTRWQHVGVIYYVINVKFREGRGAFSTFPASLDSSGGVRAGCSASPWCCRCMGQLVY